MSLNSGLLEQDSIQSKAQGSGCTISHDNLCSQHDERNYAKITASALIAPIRIECSQESPGSSPCQQKHMVAPWEALQPVTPEQEAAARLRALFRMAADPFD